MRKRSLKREQAISLDHGMSLCVKHAHDVLNRSVPQIADLIGESHNTLYKWLSTQRMPASKVIAFENACGASFITQYLAHSNGYLILPMPTGRKAAHRELNELGAYTHQVLAMLLDFADGKQDQQEVIGAVTLLIEDLAHQRGNVEKHQQPDLRLDP